MKDGRGVEPTACPVQKHRIDGRGDGGWVWGAGAP